MTTMADRIEGASPPYRKGTLIPPREIAFVFNAGGIGDFINWVTPIQYAIETNPHIKGIILTRPYFDESLVRHWFRGQADRFTVETIDCEILTDDPRVRERYAVIPDGRQFANANFFHLLDLGFIYYAQVPRASIPRDWYRLPTIEGDEASIHHFNLPPDYGVILTSATAENRRLTAEAINGAAEHLRRRGIMPVFLGKREIIADYGADSPEGILTEGVIDLREKTNLTEAACIMSGARLTLGIDGGLLHLACCTRAPVIFGFTTIEPRYRVPPRREGTKTIVVTPPEALACRFCNSRMTFLLGHNFKDCLYRDNLCTQTLDTPTLTRAINQILA